MIALGDIAVMGGGCYGTFYLQQLLAAQTKGTLTFRRLRIVDRDSTCQAASYLSGTDCELAHGEWGAFLDHYLDTDMRDRDGLADMIVPTPLMPHLMAEWLVRHARREWPDREVTLVPAERPFGTPYDRLHTDGVRYVSFADWICPTHCVEPLLCPAIRAPRTWEMSQTVRDWSERLAAERLVAAPAIFSCRHVAHGVGMFPVRAAFDASDALRAVAAVPDGGDQVIGSISACHGAVALLRISART